ncbi:uncharacterized protein LOC132754269 [Ruditapes philippinarum]|uniref:uncharacterized protein LOC132754269 n=1 Tax=Ruditapes philippinarum TaxID=129788 RepID=UPI00295B9432|nr:uncharacterized protein LOC132754269 [Ruditapes philippinarum]
MDLVDTQTFGFIIAFLVAFAGFVIACAKCFPNENIRRSTQKTKVPVRLKDHDQSSLRNRRPTIPRTTTPIMSSVGTLPPRPHSSTPGAPIPPTEPPSPTPRAPPIPPTSHTPTAIFPSPMTIAPTHPIRGPTPMQKVPTPTTMPPISMQRAPTPTPRAPTPLATPPTPTPRAPTPPDRAPTPPPVTPIQQQADMAQQLAEEQERMAVQSTELEIEVWRKVFDQSTRKLKTYLNPDEIIDLDTGFELFSRIDRRDIKDETITTKKNEAILTKVRSKGELAYKDFKERLKMTNQSKLADLLTYTERGLNTDEIEQQLDKMLEEQITRTVYDKQKREVKDGLFEFYKTRHSKIFLSPLFEEKDTPLASFYIRPELSSKVSTSNRNDEKIPVESLSGLFKTKNIENREIYVLADAGLGKTAFSKYLANVWCQAHCPDKDLNELLLKDDVDCMQEFDFLFLVLLRDSDDLCSIDELIFEKIISNLGLEETLSKDILLKILKNEKCIIILDGLDEWTHPDKKCYKSPRSIPHRNYRKKCTILTTTRPWKLGVLDLNSCQLGKRVELTQLSGDSAVTLIGRILQRWKSHPNKDALDSDVIQFIEAISQRENHELAFVPLLLIYTTCLWCEGVQIGDSKCDLYINIVELLLSRTIQIHGELPQSPELSSSDIPECFAEYDNCTKYYSLLMHIGKLAYYTLFNETKENTLVFDGSIARKYIAQDEIKFTLHSGMLSESTSKTARKKFSKVSFSHKTVQEFFAAIFISSQSDAQKTVVEKCTNVQDILDMSKICEFISKMNADLVCAISKDLMSVINEDEKTRGYRTRTGVKGFYNTPLYNIQKMFMSCLQEMPESENIQFCLQDFFIEEKTEVHSKQLQRLLKQNKTNIKSLEISIMSTSSSLREIIDLFSLTDLSHIQKLFYIGDRKKEETKISRILFPSLQYVTLWNGTWTNDEENLNENMARCQNLQYLYIRFFTLSHKILETIFNFISGQKSMKELTLHELDCKEHGRYRRHDYKRWNLDLSQHSTLSKLHLRLLPGRLQLNISTQSLVNVTLWSINLDETSLLLSRNMVNIERVELWFIEMSARSLQNFITVLENLPQSVTVVMNYIKPETEYDRVRENIRRSQTFHVIQDSGWWGTFEFKTIKPSKE